MTPAIVSRCRLFQFLPLTPNDVRQAVVNALRDKENGFGELNISADEQAIDHIVNVANGMPALR